MPKPNAPVAKFVQTPHMTFFKYLFTIGKNGKKEYTYEVPARLLKDRPYTRIGYTVGGGRWEEDVVTPAGFPCAITCHFITGPYAGKYQVKIGGGYDILDASYFEVLGTLPIENS